MRLTRPTTRLLVALLLCVGPFAPAATEWVPTPGELEKLAKGELVIADEVDPNGKRGSVRAAVIIHATRERVFAAMTDCAQALLFVPHLELCRVLQTDAVSGAQLIEHSVNLRWFLPRTRYVFRAEYRTSERVSFHAVSGDLRVNDGVWLLTDSTPKEVGHAPNTLVSYRVSLEPRVYVPAWLVRASLKNDLPALLRALRAHCESALLGHKP